MHIHEKPRKKKNVYPVALSGKWHSSRFYFTAKDALVASVINFEIPRVLNYA